jgi:hypothetical protein
MQPFIYMDDVERAADSVAETQAGNITLASMMDELCLGVHPVKSGYMVCGTEGYKEGVKLETEKDPIMFGDIVLKQKSVMKYLGDILIEDGLLASVEATITEREGKVKGSILELNSLSEDFRMDVVGGKMAAIDL